MSIEKSICNRIGSKLGIVAVRVQPISNITMHECMINPPVELEGKDVSERKKFEAELMAVLGKALALYDLYGNTGSLRIVRGDSGPDSMTIVCFAEGNYAVAVAIKTGHPISKSLRRLVDRAFNANLSKAA